MATVVSHVGTLKQTSSQFKARGPVSSPGPINRNPSCGATPLRRNSKPARMQTNRIRPAGTVVTNLPRHSGRRASCGYWYTETSPHDWGVRSGTDGTGMMSPRFVTPTEQDRKTTTLRKRIRESQASNISPTSSPPKGATKLQRCCPLEIGVRLWEFLFPRARTCHRIS